MNGKTKAANNAEKTDKSIKKYSALINAIPIEKQAVRLSEEAQARWENLLKKSFCEVFPKSETKIEISREDILNEKNCYKKLVKTLVWGYPTGGRGKHIENILSYLENNGNSSSPLCKILDDNKGQNLTKKELEELIKTMDNVNGLGESTWSKFLYFFEIKVEIPEHGFQRCQIYDAKIKDSLNIKNSFNAPQFNELEEFNKKCGISMWKQDDKGKEKNNYFKFMELLSALSDEIGFDKDDERKLDKLENFLFHYNLDFKF